MKKPKIKIMAIGDLHGDTKLAKRLAKVVSVMEVNDVNKPLRPVQERLPFDE